MFIRSLKFLGELHVLCELTRSLPCAKRKEKVQHKREEKWTLS
jgi:hypothetical protein